jgi:hypothetical protein
MAVFATVGLGCAVDATGSDPVASTSQALAQVSTGSDVPPPYPDCGNVVPTTVWAMRFAPSDPGYFDLHPYAIHFPALPVVVSEPACRDYEHEIAVQVSHANGFEHLVSVTDPHPFYDQTGGMRPSVYYGVGINDADTPSEPAPQVFDNLGVPPTQADWDAEYNLALSHSAAPVAAVFPPMQCVQVKAFDPGKSDDGDVIGFYTVMDLHDPKGPAWYAP